MQKPKSQKRSLDLIRKVIDDLGTAHGDLRQVEGNLSMSCFKGYRTNHFELEELVYPAIFHTLGEKAWWYLDESMLWTIDSIWEFFDTKKDDYAVYINGWKWGIPTYERGLRTFDTTTGASLSQHKFGKAFDISVVGVKPEDVFGTVIKNQDAEDFCFITTIKLYDWGVHIDARNTGMNDILILESD